MSNYTALKSGLATLQLTYEASDFLCRAKRSVKKGHGGDGGCLEYRICVLIAYNSAPAQTTTRSSLSSNFFIVNYFTQVQT